MIRKAIVEALRKDVTNARRKLSARLMDLAVRVRDVDPHVGRLWWGAVMATPDPMPDEYGLLCILADRCNTTPRMMLKKALIAYMEEYMPELELVETDGEDTYHLTVAQFPSTIRENMAIREQRWT